MKKTIVFVFALTLFTFGSVFCMEQNNGTGMRPFGNRRVDRVHNGNGRGTGRFPFGLPPQTVAPGRPLAAVVRNLGRSTEVIEAQPNGSF